MAMRHDDGSVTLTAEEFRTCAQHLEMSSSRLFDFLTEHPGGGTKEQLVKDILQRLDLASFTPDTPAN